MMALDYFMLPRLQEGYNDRLRQDTDKLKKSLEHDGDLTKHGGKGPQDSTKRK